jgi:hypothetical protein
LLPRAAAAKCPQLTEGDIRALAEKSGVGPIAGKERTEIPHCSGLLPH